ncbi:MAG: hypothetical protein PVF48_09195 [Syntrophobacterales bacterium]|jgi:hypothetical protein
MRRLATIALTLFAIGLIATPATLLADKKTVTVVADGYSYLGDNDTIKTARERALAEAERNAVEQGSYSYLESQTTVKNYQVTTDEIKSQVKGVIVNKKILVDEMEKETLRYHVRLEAQVKYDDLNTMPKQQQVSGYAVQEQQPQSQSSPTPQKVTHSKSSQQQLSSVQKELKRLKHEDPHHYIRFMTRIQPKINNPDVVMERLRRMKARDPGAAYDIMNMLNKTPVKKRGKSELMIRLRFIKKHRPQEYIYVMEMLFPEIRPRSLERYWLKKRAVKHKSLTASSPKAPVRQ